jgi:hypothetical protein
VSLFCVLEFPGRFESYWHFYHMGVRFGHWLDCAVIVDGKETEKQEVTTERSVASSVSADWNGKWSPRNIFTFIVTL